MSTIPKPIRDAYTLADVTGINSLEKSDLTFLIHALGNVGSSEEVQAIYEFCNNNGSRGITLEEFGAWWHSYPHKQVYNAFVAVDDDNSNSLEEHEFDVLIKKLGCTLSEDELEEAFDACDSDGFGGVSLQEFGEWWQNYPHKQIYNAFTLADDDGSGSLGKEELATVVRDLG